MDWKSRCQSPVAARCLVAGGGALQLRSGSGGDSWRRTAVTSKDGRNRNGLAGMGLMGGGRVMLGFTKWVAVGRDGRKGAVDFI